MTAPVSETIRDLAAGYALGALTADETRQFEAALAQSAELRREVAEYREVNALLGLTRGEPAPPALRARLMDRVGNAKVAPLRPTRRLAQWLMPIAVAASTVLAVRFGIDARTLTLTVDRQRDSLVSIAARLARREATLDALLMAQFELTVVQLTTAGAEAPGIQFFWNRRSNQGVLHAFRLPPAPPGKVYQLWLIPRQGAPIPSQTFSSAPDGHALVEAFTLPIQGGFDAAAITVEPEGGSRTPTLPIYLVGKVSGP